MLTKNEFSNYTEKIKKLMPTWFNMKFQSYDSVGLEFLNIFGLTLEEANNIINYAYEQTILLTSDVNYNDVIYKGYIPNNIDTNNISNVKANGYTLSFTNTIDKLFNLDKDDDSSFIYYFLDHVKKIIYVSNNCDVDNTYTDGKIYISDGYDNPVDILIPLEKHQVWNFLDEFGALFSCPRITNESNYDYKKRLLDVFRYPANSTKKGLVNGLAREIGCRVTDIWSVPAKRFVIKEPMVILNSIDVDGKPITEEQYYIDNRGYVIIPPIDSKRKLVSYIKNIELNVLNSSKSVKFSNEIYKSNGDITQLLSNYIDEIRSTSSVLWDDFNYDQTLWVKDDKEFQNNFSFIPSRLDSSIKGFSDYGYSNCYKR